MEKPAESEDSIDEVQATDHANIEISIEILDVKLNGPEPGGSAELGQGDTSSTGEDMIEVQCELPHEDPSQKGVVVNFSHTLPKRDWERFLVARSGVHEDACRQLRDTLVWRAQTLPIDRESCLGELRKGKFFHHGFDMEGRPVLAFQAQLHDPKDTDLEEITRMMIYIVEQALGSGNSHNQTKFVFLLYAPRGSQMDVRLVRTVVKLFQDYYPERMCKLFIFPIGPLVKWFFGLVAMFLDPGLRAKIELVQGREPPELKEVIPQDNLLRKWGGIDNWEFDPDGV